MGYKEFLKEPQIEKAFDEMFNEQKEYFIKKCRELGFKKGRLELISIKMAFVSTDIYFTELHNTGLKKKAGNNPPLE